MKNNVIIPTLNEEENIGSLISEIIESVGDDVVIVVVDDDSNDRTQEIVLDISKRNPNVRLIARKGEKGLGSAVQKGAMDIVGGFTAVMDADFSHHPRYLPAMFDKLSKGYDVVVGSRYVTDGKTDEQWGIGRLFLSWWANTVYTQLILGIKVKDATAGFKCWKSDTLRGMGLDRVRSNGYVFQVEMQKIASLKNPYKRPVESFQHHLGGGCGFAGQ